MSNEPNDDATFFVLQPSEPGPVVVEVPHAGTCIDERALSFRQLPPRAIEAGVLSADADLGSDLIWRGTEALGVARIVANLSRYVIDLNTTPRYPTPYQEKMPEPLNNRRRRSACGFSWSAPPLPRMEIERRVNSYLEPYHDAVTEQLRRAKSRCGAALLLSSHTFPEGQVADGIDVVIGTRHGQTASPAIRSHIEEALSSAGLRVALEEPFAGGLAAERHGRPCDGVSVVQIEIRRALLSTGLTQGQLTRFEIDEAAVHRFSALMASLARSLTPIVTASSAEPNVTLNRAGAPQALQAKSP